MLQCCANIWGSVVTGTEHIHNLFILLHEFKLENYENLKNFLIEWEIININCFMETHM